ncbi:TIGR02444 family protein [Halomonas sp. HNIBRBA4712]|uniref:TIGR02444 family protein n=1 Tax=Halomonas sp. HNIBRBA4712 TaxID=3373087 RepID=UPI0037450DFD
MSDSNRSRRLEQTPLWDFACAFYADDEAAAACLTLQDEAGVDVCELLFHVWLYRHRLMAQPAALEKEREARNRWQQGVTQTLRALRRDLKEQARASESVHKLRETIKCAELAAERENLAAWQVFALGGRKGETVLETLSVTPQDVALWLRNRLCLPNFSGHSLLIAEQSESVESAWQLIASRLDSSTPAR